MSAVMRLFTILIVMIAFLLLLFVGGAWVVQQSRKAIEGGNALEEIQSQTATDSAKESTGSSETN